MLFIDYNNIYNVYLAITINGVFTVYEQKSI